MHRGVGGLEVGCMVRRNPSTDWQSPLSLITILQYFMETRVMPGRARPKDPKPMYQIPVIITTITNHDSFCYY